MNRANLDVVERGDHALCLRNDGAHLLQQSFVSWKPLLLLAGPVDLRVQLLRLPTAILELHLSEELARYLFTGVRRIASPDLDGGCVVAALARA